MDLNYWSVRSYSWDPEGMGLMESIFILVSCEYHFIRINDNLVQHPNINIQICLNQLIVLLFCLSYYLNPKQNMPNCPYKRDRKASLQECMHISREGIFPFNISNFAIFHVLQKNCVYKHNAYM